MINLNQNIKQVKRDRLYFDRFRYCTLLKVQDFECLRSIFKSTTTRASLTNDIVNEMTRRIRRSKLWGGLWASTYQESDHKLFVAQLNDIADALWARRSDIKITFSGSLGYVYANDLKFLEYLNQKPYVLGFHLHEAVVNRPRNTILLNKSNHSKRSYFKEKKFTTDEKERLCNFLNNQQDIKISTALQYWLKKTDYPWSRNYFFIDYTSELTITMLGLVVPNIISKTCTIITEDK